ncbi:hypothetical protein BsWGS_08916 [Bradybaena similaris]
MQTLTTAHFADMWLRMKMWIFFTSLWSGGLGITCLDAMGKSVDWYAIYKIPKISRSSNWIIKEGLAPFYLDVNSPSWTFLNQSMNDSQQPVYQTLTPIYSGKKQDMMYILYNDEPPSSQASFESEGGHTKGVVAFDKNSGFWLIHSSPHFPPSDSYSFPKNSCGNGQSFLCVTFPYKQLGNVARQLWYNEPHIYDKVVPDSFIKDYPDLKKVIDRHTYPGSPYYSVLQMTSLGGQKFTSFAKSGRFGADLYDRLVAPRLQQDLLVKTWSRGGGGKLDSNCSTTYKVMKITSISMQASGDTFVFKADHSKWAITTSVVGFRKEKVLQFQELEKWTCIGDINRMKSQFKRGGGTMCLQNPSVWQAYTSSVDSYEKC